MAPTLVSAAVGALLAAALLGDAFDRRAVAVVVAAAVLPGLDAAASLAVPGATNALLHAVWAPLLAGGLLYWDGELRSASTLREQGGPRAVRVAWVALASFVVAGVGAALFAGEGAALLYPLEDARYLVRGRLVFSTQEGVVQTFLTPGATGAGILPIERVGGAVADPVSSWINPDGRPGFDPGADREFRFVEAGWQLVVVAAAAATLAVRFRFRGEGAGVSR
ncbi:hypothetical protein PN419_04165 [Halorubrum ezzemoulense]|uniref:hypothetical protein n=1 Tax=Halorubrum TaxID=56688 RepID=UPI000A2E9496|nr:MULTISPECIES: hypothetical protein [Halorubrum]MDB9248208.1 hypothetical protein [Halorubrum ezzemoulense]MDB9257883.1 hypothetical protein [Halorubrum ezzemoulense]MDB9261755.1 hypothetical protein [Halorubrum ezzemoulense]MDB9265258.1 hypothetical protein [Halorubrum ezzemoulense]MDB9268244.1 hypothetical protein [Halorubrum ezzemoulense]